MFRLLIYVLIAYVVYRVLRSILLPAPRAGASQRPATRRRHAADFSDVQDAEFEDLTPPPPPDLQNTAAGRPSGQGPEPADGPPRKTGT